LFVVETSLNNFYFGNAPPETTKGQDILGAVDIFFSSHDLAWKSSISACTAGAASMSGSLKGFVTLAKKTNIGIVFTHVSCTERPSFQNRYCLRCRKYWMSQSKWLTASVEVVVNLCSATEVAPAQVLLHVEVTWLSRGRVPSRFCELRERLIIFFMPEESEMADLLSDETWCNKVAFLANISQALNTVNKNIQGKKENILLLTKLTLLRKI
jgi:hypothetical protein